MSKGFKVLTPIVGGFACNARCKFCVAGMTPLNGVKAKAADDPDFATFDRVCAYVRQHDCKSVLLTSKGEPTLWPDQVTEYLRTIQPHGFESVELQTNGICIHDRKPVTDEHLTEWRKLGLTLVAISVVHFDAELNRQTYLPYRKEYIDLAALIKDLHDHGFAVRLAVVMLRGHIDGRESLKQMIEFARANKVEQLTVRPVNKPEVSRDDEISQFIEGNHLTDEQKADVRAYLDEVGNLVSTLPWGGRIYNVDGQNVCYTNSLTTEEEAADTGRQLIYFPGGRVSDAWQEESVPFDQFINPQSAATADGEVKVIPLKVVQKKD